MTIATPSVYEVTMAAPDIIRVELRDAPINRGAFTHMPTPVTGTWNNWYSYTNPVTGLTDNAWPMGLTDVNGKYSWAKFSDITDQANFLVRTDLKTAGSYSITGGYTISGVYYMNEPYDQGFFTKNATYGGTLEKPMAFRHWLYIRLNANLVAGSYLIRLPASTGLSAIRFNYNDRATRASSIRGTFIGHRALDTLKLAYLTEKVLGYAAPSAFGEGALDFINTYALSSFEIIDAAGATVWTGGAITLKASPGDHELFQGFSNSNPTGSTTITSYLSSITNYDVYSVSAANPCNVVLQLGQGGALANGTLLGCGLWYGGFNNIPGATPGASVKIKNVGTDGSGRVKFDITFPDGTNVNSTGTTYTNGIVGGPAADKMFATYTANAAATYVYRLDYSAFVPSVPGYYRIRVPGLGVSDAFLCDESAYYQFAATSAQGEDAERQGYGQDGRFGFVRDVALLSGSNNCTIYKGNLPMPWGSQGFSAIGNDTIPVESGALGSWLTNVVSKAGQGGRDAGDSDTFTSEQMTTICNWQLYLFDLVPAAAQNTSFNVRKLSSILGSSYAELDSAPDLIHMAGFQLAWLKDCQEPSGAVPGGMDGRYQGPSGEGSPSSIAIMQWYAFLPDHATTYTYAGSAAMFARILKSLGYTTLGGIADQFLTSAKAAFDWAELVYQKLTADVVGLSGAVGSFNYGDSVQDGLGNTATVWSWRGSASSVNTDFSSGFQIYNRTGGFASGTITDTTTGATATISHAANPNGGFGVGFDPDYYYRAATGATTTIAFTGDMNHTTYNSTTGTCTITNIPDTSILSVGWEIRGSTIPAATGWNSSRAVIKSIDNSTTVTLASSSSLYAINGHTPAGNVDGFLNGITNGTGVSLTACVVSTGWSAAKFYGYVGSIQESTSDCARRYRFLAAPYLARALGAGAGDPYRAIFVNDQPNAGSNGAGPEPIAGFEFTQDPVAQSVYPAVVSSLANVVRSVSLQGVNASEGNQGYRLQAFYSITEYGGIHQMAMHAFSIKLNAQGLGTVDPANDARRLATMQASVAQAHGANQFGMSCTVGFGPRWFNNLTHADALVIGATIKPGVNSSVPRGITAFWSYWSNSGHTGTNMWGAGIDYYWIQDGYTLASPGISLYKTLEPFRGTWPCWHMIDVYGNIDECEYSPSNWTFQLFYSMFLHGWDGNTQIVPSPQQIIFQVRTTT